MFETEVTRKIRNPPALSLALETGATSGEGLFPERREVEGEEDEALQRDVLAELWAF
jgi:hypothetical protein